MGERWALFMQVLWCAEGGSMPTDINEIENKLWAAADELRANSRLGASESSVPSYLVWLSLGGSRS